MVHPSSKCQKIRLIFDPVQCSRSRTNPATSEAIGPALQEEYMYSRCFQQRTNGLALLWQNCFDLIRHVRQEKKPTKTNKQTNSDFTTACLVHWTLSSCVSDQERVGSSPGLGTCVLQQDTFTIASSIGWDVGCRSHVLG